MFLMRKPVFILASISFALASARYCIPRCYMRQAQYLVFPAIAYTINISVGTLIFMVNRKNCQHIKLLAYCVYCLHRIPPF